MSATKGPWNAFNAVAGGTWNVPAQGRLVAEVVPQASKDETESTADLIAAAPELLESLQHAVAFIEVLDPGVIGTAQAMEMYRAAIRKARGES